MYYLNNLCYSKIKNYYYYAKIYDKIIIVDKKRGFFNATDLCNKNNLNLEEWIKYNKTNVDGLDDKSLYEIKNNNIEELNGIYLSDLFFLDIFSWVFPDFYKKFNKIILKKIIKKNKLEILFFKNNEILKKINEIEISFERFRSFYSY